jgi:hypothetical protein
MSKAMEALDELMRWKAYMVEEGYTSKDDDTIEILRDYITTTEKALAEKDAAPRMAIKEMRFRRSKMRLSAFSGRLSYEMDDKDAQVEKAIGGGE